MKHFDTADWTDFARVLLSGERQAVIEEHLAGGCPACIATGNWLQKAVQASAADRRWPVPSDLLSAVESIYRQFHVNPPLLDRVLMRLVYDSALGPQAVGARATRSSCRQVAYEAGDYYLDLSLQRSAANVSLLGQLANRKTPDQSPSGQSVILMAGNRMAARAVTNEFGEFTMEFRHLKNLRLCFPIASGGAQIEVDLEGL